MVKLGSGIGPDDLLIHDERAEQPTLAYLLSRMVHDPDEQLSFPEPMGVFRAIERPTYGGLIESQMEGMIKSRGKGNLQDLLTGDETWTVQ